jgi:two-component system response regulator FlrC
MDGMELLRRTRRERPGVAVVVLTAHGSIASAVEAVKLGAFDYLEKPLESPAVLRQVVARAVETRPGVSGSSRAPESAPQLTWGAPAMAAVEALLRKVAPTPASVLLLGESGTGKEVAARWIHAHSRRASGPFVAVNCAALSETLLESDLFGHERGAFTGAAARKQGKIESAAGGTFFLDEVGELKPELQTKLLRVLQERCFERVGSTTPILADVRWVAATNRDLTSEMREGRFREDLYHRLAVFPVHLPPLRARREDIPALARTLLGRAAHDLGREAPSLDEDALAALVAAPWPGNIRDLSNTLSRAAILAEGPTINAADLAVASGVAPEAQGAAAPQRESHVPTMDEAEQAAIRKALEKAGGNRKKAAEHLGIGLRTLYEKLKRYGIR